MIKQKRKNKRRMRRLLIFFGSLAAVIVIFVVLMLTVFMIRQSDVEGCVNSNATEINEAVYKNDYCRNSLYLLISNQIDPVENMPFVSSVKIKLVTPWHVKLIVNEENLAGYIYDNVSGTYTYLDRGMTIAEKSSKKVDGLIEIKGVSIPTTESGDAGQPLPTEPTTARTYLVSLCDYIRQYEMSVDSLTVESSGAVTMVSGNITIKMGLNVNTEEKFKRLNVILPQLKGQSGTIDLTGWTSEGDDIIFKPDSTESGDAKKSEEST
jgi:cell division protein FtsQ